MKKTICVLAFLLLLSSSYLYADPWGNQSIGISLLNWLFVSTTDAFSFVSVFMLILGPSKYKKNVLIIGLFWYALFIGFTLYFFNENQSFVNTKKNELEQGDYTWRNYYAIIAVGLAVTILYSLYYLYIKVIRKNRNSLMELNKQGQQ